MQSSSDQSDPKKTTTTPATTTTTTTKSSSTTTTTEKAPPRRCSACLQITHYNYNNPLLGVPLCITCYDIYSYDDYSIVDNNEQYCRWCGQGEGELLLCDTCPKGFCSRCIRNNFGETELERIKNLTSRWSCFVCSPQPLKDLIKKRGWDQQPQKGSKSKSSSSSSSSPTTTAKEENAAKKAKLVSERKGLICYDVCRGRERIDIPVINDIDDAGPPIDFVYVSQPVAGEGVQLTNNPHFLICCSCTDNCRDPTRCECIRNSSGLNYDLDGRLVEDKPGGIYECNALCSCHAAKCKNRVVGRGPSERLEVFRCTNPAKGWGIRCRSDILPGTYIADYIGEILLEADAETRGLSICDEYLYTMDCWGRSQACLKLSQLGLKATPKKIPRHLYTNASTTSEAELRKLLGEEFTDHLIAKGAVDRSIAMGREIRQSLLRSDPNPLSNMTNSTSNSSGSITASSSQLHPEKVIDKKEKSRRIMASWLDRHLSAREQVWSQASAVITDRSVVEVEEQGDQFIIDAR